MNKSLFSKFLVFMKFFFWTGSKAVSSENNNTVESRLFGLIGGIQESGEIDWSVDLFSEHGCFCNG